MKILIFSDSHLTHVFDEKKYRFLKKIIEQADKVIINGDFWDGFITSFDRFINSPWKKLFPLLKAKKTVYIYGNHDHSKFSDRRVKLFSTVQTQKYELKIKDKTYTFEHGHSSFVFYNWEQRISPRLLRYLTIRAGYVEKFLTKSWGRSTKYFGHHLNRRLKKYATPGNGHVVIFGHTHHAEHDKKINFVNTGYIQYGLAQYVILDGNRLLPQEKKYS